MIFLFLDVSIHRDLSVLNVIVTCCSTAVITMQGLDDCEMPTSKKTYCPFHIPSPRSFVSSSSFCLCGLSYTVYCLDGREDQGLSGSPEF